MEKLKIYQKSLDLVFRIYKLLKSNATLEKDFSLNDQLKRASVSVPTNISEGYNRSQNQFRNYLHIASGSANEVVTLLIIIQGIFKIDTKELQEEYKYLGKQIFSLIKKIN